MSKLDGRLGFITGGGRGIGRAIAIAFAREGANIVVAARTAAQVQHVADEIKAEFGVETLPVICDVSDIESVTRAFESATKHFGRGIDILVNNAGIAESATVAKTDDELWRRHIEINLTGTFYCTRAALPSMVASGWGRIINISSIAGKAGAAYIAAYSASKHGVIGLTRSVALEVASKGITANAICPGYVETDMATHAIENITARTGKTADEAIEILKQMSPQNRLVSVEEVAAVAVLLASEEGRGINGQSIVIDGGVVMP